MSSTIPYLSYQWHLLILPSESAAQTLIVFFGGAAFHVTRMNGKFWAISLALGFASLPLGYLIRCIPNEPVLRFFYKIRLMSEPEKEALPSTRPNAA